MPIPVTSWDEIDQASFDAARALQTEIVVEKHPEIATRSGAISDLVLTLHGVLGAGGAIERARLLDANSILLAIQNPGSIDDATLDQLFGNYFVSRRVGSYGRGRVSLVFSQAVPLVIPQGFVFSAGTRDFTATASFAIRLSAADVLSDTDVVLVLQPDGTFVASVDVQAVAIGSSGGLRQGDLLTSQKALPFLIRIFATEDFTDATDPESNADLVLRLEAGIAAHSWSNNTNLTALIRQQTGFENALVSVIGAGDPEMLRDKHSLFPIAYGNRVDVYVKAPALPSVFTLVKPALFVGTGANGPTWQITLDRDDIPALYAVTRLLRVGRIASAVVAPTSTVRSFVNTAGDPDIANALETGFSRFQTVVVTFTDAAESDDTLTENVTTVDYQLTGSALTGIDTLQAALTTANLKPLAGDIVVRAAVPCLVSLDIDFDRITSELPTTKIATALASYVNQINFGSGVFASRVISIVSSFLPAGINLQRVRLTGVILGPDGSKKLYRSFEFLVAPDDAAHMITPNTVGFFLDPSDISFNTLNQ